MVNAHRKALEQHMWHGRAMVKVWEEYEDPISFVTKHGEVTKYEDIPCKLSHKTFAATSSTGAGAVLTKEIKLSLGNEYDIPPGSKIIVTQNGITEEYTRSGKPAMFRVHQEIELELFKGWA